MAILSILRRESALLRKIAESGSRIISGSVFRRSAAISILGTRGVVSDTSTVKFARFSPSPFHPFSKDSVVHTTVRIMSSSPTVGNELPDAVLSYLDASGSFQTVSTSKIFQGKRVVLFGVPGAFTPVCSISHLPGFIEKADEFKSKGVDTIVCLSVNDAFVMRAWGESLGAGDKVLLLADDKAEFTKALGLDIDLTDKGLGVRSLRYALLAENGILKSINLEEGTGTLSVSAADEILKLL